MNDSSHKITVFSKQNLVSTVALFYIFTTLLCSLIEDIWVFISAFAFSFWIYHISCTLWKTPLHTCEGLRVKNKSNILIL